MNLKNLVLAGLIYIGVIVFFYLSISFVVWELNPSKWAEVSRVILAIFGNFIALFIAGHFFIFGIKQ